VDVRGTLSCGQNVTIDVNTVFIGDVTLGDNVTIAPFTIVSNSVIGDETNIHSHSNIDGADIGTSCNIGPYARIRPQTKLEEGAKVGNFVETKKSVIGKGSKVNHLTYIGDAKIGENTNIGAGTITCNYDGVNKHQTKIGDEVFIGSGVELVAPIEVENGATVGQAQPYQSTYLRKSSHSSDQSKKRSMAGRDQPKRKKSNVWNHWRSLL